MRFLPLYLLLLPLTLTAQSRPTGSITGRVLSAVTEAPIAEAIVTVEGTDLRTSTTVSGSFRLDSIPPGVYTLRAIAIGYEPALRSDIVVSSGRPAEVALLMRERPVELAELEVRAGSYFPPATETRPGSQSLGAEEVRRAPGVQEDVIRAVALLPGVGVTSAARNDLVVRGGAPFENLFVVDHLEVPNINHFGSQGSTGGPVSLININFVEEARFSAGGFGAEFGDRVGSATEITIREGNAERVAGGVNLSATGFGAMAEGPLGKRGTFVASARRSYLDLLFKLAGFNFLPSYYDGQVKFTQRLSERDQLSWITVAAIDRVDFNNASAKDRVDNSRILRLDQNQYFSGLTWRRSFEHARLSVTAGRTFSRFNSLQFDSLTPPQPIFQNRSTEGENSLRVDYTRDAAQRLSWSLGSSARYASRLRYQVLLPGFLRTDQAGVPQPLSVDTSFTAFRAGAWADLTARLSPSVRATIGARADYYDFLRHTWRAAPRASLSVGLGRTTLQVAGGRYWQAPSYVWLVGDSSNARVMRPFRADQVVLGLQRLLRPDLKLQLEGYYKRYADYPARVFRPQAVLAPAGFEDVKSDIPFGLEPLVSRGRGRAYGVELFLQKKLSAVPVYGLMSLTVGRSEFVGLDGIERSGAFDARVIGNLLVGWRPNPSWELSGKFRISSGLPTTPFITTGASAGQLDFTRYNADRRLPTFHALDLRADRRWSWRGVQLATYVDVQNVYGRKNISQRVWNERKQLVEEDETLGVLPSVGVMLEF